MKTIFSLILFMTTFVSLNPFDGTCASAFRPVDIRHDKKNGASVRLQRFQKALLKQADVGITPWDGVNLKDFLDNAGNLQISEQQIGHFKSKTFESLLSFVATAPWALLAPALPALAGLHGKIEYTTVALIPAVAIALPAMYTGYKLSEARLRSSLVQILSTLRIDESDSNRLIISDSSGATKSFHAKNARDSMRQAMMSDHYPVRQFVESLVRDLLVEKNDVESQ